MALLVLTGGCSIVSACTLVGCLGGLRVDFNRPATTSYRVEATVPGGESVVVVECTDISRCSTESVYFSDFYPDNVTIKVITAAGTTTKSLRPQYVETHPNGPNCEPTCRTGRVSVDLP